MSQYTVTMFLNILLATLLEYLFITIRRDASQNPIVQIMQLN